MQIDQRLFCLFCHRTIHHIPLIVQNPLARFCMILVKNSIQPIGSAVFRNQIRTSCQPHRLLISCHISFHKLPDNLHPFLQRYRIGKSQPFHPVLAQPQKRSSMIYLCIRKCVESAVKCSRFQKCFAVTLIHFLDPFCCTFFIYCGKIFDHPTPDQFFDCLPAFYHQQIRQLLIFHQNLNGLLIRIGIFPFQNIFVLNIQPFFQVSCVGIILISRLHRQVCIIRSNDFPQCISNKLGIFPIRCVCCIFPLCVYHLFRFHRLTGFRSFAGSDQEHREHT